MRSFAPGSRRGGYGWITVDVHNRHKDIHELALRVADNRTEGGSIAVRRSLEVASQGKERVTLPVPAAGLPASLIIDLDGREAGRISIASSTGQAITTLNVGFGDRARTAWEALDAFADPKYRATGVRTLACAPDDLPARWTSLSAFDVIVVDGTNPGLTPSARYLLASYVAGGGRLLFIEPDRLTASTPRASVDDPAGAPSSEGFGSIAFLATDLGAAELEQRRTALRAWLTEDAYDIDPWLDDGTSGPIPAQFHLPQRVPGISAIPTNLFFLITVVFVLVVGPINHIWFRRRGRPWGVLLTVPIAGFVVTGSIVGYSLLREGLGIQGVISTASLLDQREHRVAGFASRTVFAGISPTALHPTAGTYLFSHDVLSRNTGTPSAGVRLALDLELNRFDGSLVPSRSPTGLVTLTTGPCRERIRFSRRSDQSLQVLDGRGLAVLRQTDALVLHDFDGNWYTMRSDGEMLPITEAQGLRTGGSQLAFFERPTADPTGLASVVYYRMRGDSWIRDRLLGHLRHPGSYVALVVAPPGFDDLGLDVSWSDEIHLVVGILDPEDIVK